MLLTIDVETNFFADGGRNPIRGQTEVNTRIEATDRRQLQLGPVMNLHWKMQKKQRPH